VERAIVTATAVTDDAAAREGNRWAGGWSARRLAGALVLAWLLPVAAHVVGLDAVLPVAAVGAAMALQRGATGVIDRLVLALAQLFGALCLAGLFISFWPWHLHPVPISVLAFTGMALLGAMTGRLRRPGRVRTRLVDRLLAGAVIAVAAVALVPYAARDLAGRIGMPLTGEDITRHFLLYDVIGRTGGYVFPHPEVARPYLPDAQVVGTGNYPQGVHFTYAVLDRFLRSANANADAVTSMNVMIWLLVATYVLLGLAVLWSLRRLAGPGVTSTRLLPVLVVAVAWLSFADPIMVLAKGYPNEIAGLGCNAVLTVLVARPLARRGDQVATVAALIVGVAFSYPLYLPYAVAVAARWAWRERLWQYWWAWAGVLVLAPLTALSPLAAMAGSSSNQVLLPGTAWPVDRPATVALLLLAVIGLVARRGLRSPARRVALFAVGSAALFAGGVAAYQIVTVGHPVYYFDKLLHLLIVVSLVALGGLARLMPRGAAAAGRRGYLQALVPGVALAMPLVLTVVLLGGAWHTSPPSRGLLLVTGQYKGSPDGARDAIFMTRMYPDGGGAINVNLMGGPWRNWYATQLASTLQGTYRYQAQWYEFLYPQGPPRTFADLDRLVASSPVRVRFFVFNEAASMLVVDSDRPNRPLLVPGAPYPVAFGDPDAPSNSEAAHLLAAKYPDRVEVVHATPPNP